MKGYIKTLLTSIIISFLSPVFAANSSDNYGITIFPPDRASPYYAPAKKPIQQKPGISDTYTEEQIKQVVTTASKVATKRTVSYFDGFYIGVGAGVNHTRTKASGSSISKIFSGEDNVLQRTVENPINSDFGDIMPAGEIFGGYGKVFVSQKLNASFYLGTELFGKYTPTDMTLNSLVKTFKFGDGTDTLETKYSVKNDYSLGGDIKFGYLITQRTMIYVLLGLDFAEFEYNISHSYNFPTDYPKPFGGTYGSSVNKWKTGIMPGLGIETMLSEKLSLRIQYVYTYYFGDYHVEYNPADIVQGDDIRSHFEANDKINDLSRGLLTLDLSYHFNGI